MEELKKLDFGAKHAAAFRGLGVVTFEDILKKFACHTVMNVHIKSRDNTTPYDEAHIRRILELIDRYDCRKYVYFMITNTALMDQMRAAAPDIPVCAGAGDDPAEDIVQKAIDHDCKKVQLFKPHFGPDPVEYVRRAVQKAHENGIVVNVFWSDDPDETNLFLDLGADVILANDYLKVANAVKARG